MNGAVPSADGDVGTPKNVDFDSIWARRQRRQTHLLIIYLWVMVMISLAWVVGYWEFSFTWLLAIFIVTLSVWRTKVFRITEEHLMQEQARVHRKRAMRGSETAEWFNFILNRWCLFSSTGLCDLIKMKLDPILKKFKPPLLEDVTIKSLTFGDQAPNIHHIQVFETSDGLPGGRKQASWLNVGKPPKELNKLDRYHIVLDMEAGLHCEQFKMVLATKIAGMSSGPDILVENLKVEGRLHAKVTFSTDAPFPHVSRLMVSFDEKPSIWFSVKVLRSLQLMEIPLLKSWIHNLVLDLVCLSVVDPYKLDLDIGALAPSAGPIMRPSPPPALGVLSIFISADGYQTLETSQSYSVDDVTFCTLTLGETVIRTPETLIGDRWSYGCNFLVTDLSQKFLIDVESKQMLSSISQATYELTLSNYSLHDGKSIDAVLDKEQTSLQTPVKLHMEYSQLPPVVLSQSPPVDDVTWNKDTVCGVMYVCVHGGFDLLPMDENGFSDPYCVIFADRKKVQTTHYVARTLNPRWETRTEFIVRDVTKTSLQFLVYDWDGLHANDDDFLGATHLSLTTEEPYVVHKPLTLSYNILNVGQVSDVNLGCIVVSAVFRPLPAVTEMTEERIAEQAVISRNKISLTASKTSSPTDIFKLLSQGHGILELTILCARNLVAMDSNGFSDPYVEVKIGNQKKFVTSVKKKTLNPVWEESVTTQLPEDGQLLELSVWDKDPLMMKDFIGSVEFTAEDLKRISSIGEPGWYLLQKTKSGQIKLGIKVLTQDMKGCLDELSVFADKQLPSISSVAEIETDQNENIAAEVAAENYSTLPKSKKKKGSSSSLFNPLKRSQSDAQVNKTDRFRFFRFKSHDKTEKADKDVPDHHSSSDQLSRNHSSESSKAKYNSSVELRHRPDSRFERRPQSLDMGSTRLASSHDGENSVNEPASNTSPIDKFFTIRGAIARYRISDKMAQELKGQIYCKLRIDSRTDIQRKQKFSSGRAVAKTPNIKVEAGEHPLDFEFEIDRGGGLPSESLFIFDIKTTDKNSHIATRGYSLKNMFADQDLFEHWLPKEHDIQFLVQMSRDSTQTMRQSRNPLSRLSHSFRRTRSTSHIPPDVASESTNGESEPRSMESEQRNGETEHRNGGEHLTHVIPYSESDDNSFIGKINQSELDASADLNSARIGNDLDLGKVNGHFETDVDGGTPRIIDRRRLSISTDV